MSTDIVHITPEEFVRTNRHCDGGQVALGGVAWGYAPTDMGGKDGWIRGIPLQKLCEHGGKFREKRVHKWEENI